MVCKEVLGSQGKPQRVAQGEVRPRQTESWVCHARDRPARETGNTEGIDLSPASRLERLLLCVTGFRFAPPSATVPCSLRGLELCGYFRLARGDASLASWRGHPDKKLEPYTLGSVWPPTSWKLGQPTFERKRQTFLGRNAQPPRRGTDFCCLPTGET